MKKFFIISISLTACLIFAINLYINKKPKVEADSASTSVQIQNVVPSFTAGPAESTASTAVAPTNVGGNITFEGTATDTNGDQ